MEKKQTKKVTRSKEAIKDLSPTETQDESVKGGATWYPGCGWSSATTVKSSKSNSSD